MPTGLFLPSLRLLVAAHGRVVAALMSGRTGGPRGLLLLGALDPLLLLLRLSCGRRTRCLLLLLLLRFGCRARCIGFFPCLRFGCRCRSRCLRLLPLLLRFGCRCGARRRRLLLLPRLSLLLRLRRLLSLLGALRLRLPLLRLRLLLGLCLLPFGLLFFPLFLTVNLDSGSGKRNQANPAHNS